MIERGQGSRLAPESLNRRRVVGQFVRQELQGHGPAKDEILGLVDDPHAAAPEFAQDPEVRGRGDPCPASTGAMNR